MTTGKLEELLRTGKLICQLQHSKLFKDDLFKSEIVYMWCGR